MLLNNEDYCLLANVVATMLKLRADGAQFSDNDWCLLQSNEKLMEASNACRIAVLEDTLLQIKHENKIKSLVRKRQNAVLKIAPTIMDETSVQEEVIEE